MKRTYDQIEKDYLKIRKEAKSSKTFKKLEEKTGLTYSEIITSLKRHPVVYERIKKQFDAGEQTQNKQKVEKNVKQEKSIVLDASVMGVSGIVDLLKGAKEKIILTSVTVKELAQMQHFEDREAKRARNVLSMAVEEEDRIICEPIDETYENADKCILEFCISNKDNVVLYTSDKEMYIFAKANAVEAKYFKVVDEPKEDTRAMTFFGLCKDGKDLILDIDFFNRPWKSIKVISDGVEYDRGEVKLKIGDDIYLASKKRDSGYTSFAHYKVISLWATKNVRLVLSRRLYDLSDIALSYKYKSFLRDFKRKIS